MIFEESNVLLFDLLEFRILLLEILTFGSQSDDLFFLFLKIHLFFIKLFLVLALTMIYLFHLVLFLLKEFFMIIQLIVQSLNLFLLLLKLCSYGIILRLGYAHRLLDRL